jgi:polysaccharide pyruvyl transferase WcaK-like protein
LIKISTDWNSYEEGLLNKTKGLSYEKEVRKMIENIRAEITTLSKAEVEDRRSKSHKSRDILEKINQDIEMVEEYLVIAALLG